jgi:5-formyltetrahydrofolate cyclo-ligase
MIYVSLLEEVDTIYIIRKALKLGKRVIIPYIQQDNDELEVSEITALESLEKGPYGILQPPWDRIKPVPLQTIELIVVPAIAFDKKNMRLGRGKGYYDRFLSKKAINNAETIGLAFDFQILESLPYDYHDKPVDQVLTN